MVVRLFVESVGKNTVAGRCTAAFAVLKVTAIWDLSFFLYVGISYCIADIKRAIVLLGFESFSD